MYGNLYTSNHAPSGIVSTLCAWKLPFFRATKLLTSKLIFLFCVKLALVIYHSPITLNVTVLWAYSTQPSSSNYPRIWERQSLKHWNVSTAAATQRSHINCVKLFISSGVLGEESDVVIVKTEYQQGIIYLVTLSAFGTATILLFHFLYWYFLGCFCKFANR